jgi:hypothetical protein
MKKTLLIGIVFLLAACGAPFRVPQQFSSSTEVFKSNDIDTLQKNAPAESVLRIAYSAPYEDVFRIVEVSAAQAQLLVEDKNKDNGLIFASKTIPIEKVIWSFVDQKWNTGGWIHSEKRFYLIRVEELSGENTAVTIFSKVQFECSGGEEFEKNYDECRNVSVPHWPSHKQRNTREMEVIHNFIKNNLISAGLI